MRGWESDEIERTSSWKSCREKEKRQSEEIWGTESLSLKQKKIECNREKRSPKRESFNLGEEFSSDCPLFSHPLFVGILTCVWNRGMARAALVEHPVETFSYRSYLLYHLP